MRILVADDHELFLKGLEFILRDNFPGVELVFAHNYPEIFKIIEKETDFNLIMTDLAMPGGRWSEAFPLFLTRKSCKKPLISVSPAIFRKLRPMR